MQDQGRGKWYGSVESGSWRAPGVGAVQYVAVLNRVVEECRTDAAVGEEFDLGELYLELTTACQGMSRFDARVIGWPPGRNQACWCRWGHKHGTCCAAAAQAALTDTRGVRR